MEYFETSMVELFLPEAQSIRLGLTNVARSCVGLQDLKSERDGQV